MIHSPQRTTVASGFFPRWLTLAICVFSYLAPRNAEAQTGTVAVSTPLAVSAPLIGAPEPAIEMVYEPREFVGANSKTLKYRLLKPFNYSFGMKYPIIVFLHGSGERGDDNTKTLLHGAKEFAQEERRKEYPAYVLIPQCPNDKKWSEVDWDAENSTLPTTPSESMELLKELLDEMVENAGIDPERIYLTGLSMGGFGTWDAVARYPNYFAAAVPICGGGDPATVARFKNTPIWCFHGTKDSVVKVNRSRQMIDALKNIGSQARYTEYPELDHDSWTPTYANPDLYQWFFAQRRSSIQD